MSDHKHIDEVSGVETTGHVWDGDVRELNQPLPKWWLYTFYLCCVWAVGYWLVYPAWPTLNDYTKGYFNYSQRDLVTSEIEAAKAEQNKYRSQIADLSLADVRKNEELFQFSIAGGAALFGENCAGCHGRGAQGFVGYPNLNDDDWLWGNSLDQIHTTIAFGIRNGHPKAHATAMPRFGVDKLLDDGQISDLANYVRSLSGLEADAAAAGRATTLFAEQCAPCHGEQAKGNTELGVPNLADAISLYGTSHEAVSLSIKTGRGGAMPAWSERLDPIAVKMLTLYVYSLGGGQTASADPAVKDAAK